MHTAGRLGISNYKISIILTGIHLRSSSSSQVLNLVRPLKVAEAEDTPDPDPDPEPPDPEPIIEKVTLDDVDGFLKCTSLNASSLNVNVIYTREAGEKVGGLKMG